MWSLEGLIAILIACGSDEVMTAHTPDPGLHLTGPGISYDPQDATLKKAQNLRAQRWTWHVTKFD